MACVFKEKIIPVIVLAALALAVLPGCAKSIVEQNGRLQIIGTQLCNKNQEPVQLKGISFLDVSFFKDYANPECFAWLRDDWGCTVIRAALYTEHNNLFRALSVKDDMKKAVQAAVETGIYIIIDWHILSDRNPQKYKTEALTFFTEMAGLYKDTPNVIYEICNEPNGADVTWKDVVKPYAVELITAIMKIAPDNVILVGTPNWSQYVDEAADDPLPFPNVMYTCHFYTGSHFGELRDKITYALEKNAPIFISEWGTTANTGDGPLFPLETLTWIEFLNEHKISWVNWSLSSRTESSAALKPIAAGEGHWADGDLTQSALFVRSLIRGQVAAIVLFADSFETENFIGGGWNSDNAGIDKTAAAQGLVSAVLKGKSMLTKGFSTRGFKNANLLFSYKSENMKDGDALSVEWFDGREWQLLQKLDAAAGWTRQAIALPPGADDNFDFQFRFVSAFADQTTRAGLDEVSLVLDRK